MDDSIRTKKIDEDLEHTCASMLDESRRPMHRYISFHSFIHYFYSSW